MDLPSEDVLRDIVKTYARLRAEHGEAIGAPPLVLAKISGFAQSREPIYYED